MHNISTLTQFFIYPLYRENNCNRNNYVCQIAGDCTYLMAQVVELSGSIHGRVLHQQ